MKFKMLKTVDKAEKGQVYENFTEENKTENHFRNGKHLFYIGTHTKVTVKEYVEILEKLGVIEIL